MFKRLILTAGIVFALLTPAHALSGFEKSGQATLTIPGIILLLMLVIMIGAMFIGFNYSRGAGFFTMAVFGTALLMLVAYVFG